MILLDVGENTLNPSGDKNETFLSRAKACVSKIIQRKVRRNLWRLFNYN